MARLTLAVMLLCGAALAVANSCTAGQHHDGAACADCPPGKYQARKTGAPCVACAKGTWAPTEGATACLPKAEGDIACLPGQYGPVRGKTTCFFLVARLARVPPARVRANGACS